MSMDIFINHDESRQQLKAATLDWVNIARSEFGEPPLDGLPRGRIGSGSNCAIARCFHLMRSAAHIGTHVLYSCFVSRGGFMASIHHPSPVQQFIRMFDGGMFPELIDREFVGAVTMTFPLNATFQSIKMDTKPAQEKAPSYFQLMPLTSKIPSALVNIFNDYPKVAAMELTPAGGGS